MKWFYLALVVVVIGTACFFAGRWTAGSGSGASSMAPAVVEATPEYWTCPMHAEIKLPDDVPCPKCGMRLVPWSADADVGFAETLSQVVARYFG